MLVWLLPTEERKRRGFDAGQRAKSSANLNRSTDQQPFNNLRRPYRAR